MADPIVWRFVAGTSRWTSWSWPRRPDSRNSSNADPDALSATRERCTSPRRTSAGVGQPGIVMRIPRSDVCQRGGAGPQSEVAP